MIISRSELARIKLEELKNGYSAFAETKAVAERIEKGLAELGMTVHIDRTSHGCWYIPLKSDNESSMMNSGHTDC